MSWRPKHSTQRKTVVTKVGRSERHVAFSTVFHNYCVAIASIDLAVSGLQDCTSCGLELHVLSDNCAGRRGASVEQACDLLRPPQCADAAARNARRKGEEGRCADALPDVIHLFFRNQKPAEVLPQGKFGSGLVVAECEGALRAP